MSQTEATSFKEFDHFIDTAQIGNAVDQFRKIPAKFRQQALYHALIDGRSQDAVVQFVNSIDENTIPPAVIVTYVARRPCHTKTFEKLISRMTSCNDAELREFYARCADAIDDAYDPVKVYCLERSEMPSRPTYEQLQQENARLREIIARINAETARV